MSNFENIFIPVSNADASCAKIQSHFGRIKLGEIVKTQNSLVEFVCFHCSDVFYNFSNFSTHCHEHFSGIISAPPQPDELKKENADAAQMNQGEEAINASETGDNFEGVNDMDYCNSTASDSDDSKDADERDVERCAKSRKPSHGINEDIKFKLAEENFALDESPEAEEYSKYIYGYQFRTVKGWYNCTKCKYKSKENRYVRRHIFTHLRRKIFTCLICSKKLASLAEARIHKNFHKRQSNRQTSIDVNRNMASARSRDSYDLQKENVDSNNSIEIEEDAAIEPTDIVAANNEDFCNDTPSDSEECDNKEYANLKKNAHCGDDIKKGHRSEVPHGFVDFTANYDELSSGIISAPPQPDELKNENANSTASDYDDSEDDDERGKERCAKSRKPSCGINEDIKFKLAEENFALDESPEAEEYSKYIYGYQFRAVKGWYNCTKCKYKSKQNRYVRRHIFTHLRRTIFTCLICSKKLASLAEARIHKNLHKRQSNRQPSIDVSRNVSSDSYDLRKAQRTLSQPNISRKENLGSENPIEIEADATIETTEDFCNDSPSDFEGYENEESVNLKKESNCSDDIKKRLAEDEFELDDSPEAEEYSQYIYDYRFSQINGLYSCSKCEYTSSRNRHVRNHIFRHLNRKIFSCLICSKKMARLSNMRNHKNCHERERKNPASNKSIEVATSVCDDGTEDAHIRNVKTLLGTDDVQMTNTPESIEYMQYMCGNELQHKIAGKFNCPKCEFNSQNLTDVKRHLSMHFSDNIFTCMKCTTHLGNIADIRKHMRLMHDTNIGSKLFEGAEIFDDEKDEEAESESVAPHADDDDDRYIQQWNKSLISPYYDPSKVTKCITCNKTYNVRYMKRHMKIHNNEKNSLCSLCGATFIDSRSLNMHMNTHERKVTFKCDVCDRQFVQRHYLAQHRRLHSEPMPFICDICNRGYMSLWALRLHLVRHAKNSTDKI